MASHCVFKRKEALLVELSWEEGTRSGTNARLQHVLEFR